MKSWLPVSNILFWIGTGLIAAYLVAFHLSHPVMGSYSGLIIFGLFLLVGLLDHWMSGTKIG